MDGLRRVLVDGVPTLVAARGDALHPVGATLGELLAAGRDALVTAAGAAVDRSPLVGASDVLAPVDEQEVWASGVTYRRSASASPRRPTSTSSSTWRSGPSSCPSCASGWASRRSSR